MARRRFGVALLVPAPFDRDVDALRAALGDPALGRIPAHLTLVPPVNVAEDQLDAALAVLRDAAAETAPIRLILGPPVSFLPDNPVLYLAANGDIPALEKLRERVFRPPLARPLTWPFVPHVTLADEAEPQRIRAGLVALRDARLDVTFERVHLLEEGEGRRWTPIAGYDFAGRAVVGRGGLELELTTSGGMDPQTRSFADREWAAFDAVEFEGEWTDPVDLVVTARRDRAVVGYAAGWIQGARAHLSQLLVSLSRRGEGVGSRLLAAFESDAAARGANFVTVETRAGGDAGTFYKSRGYGRPIKLPEERIGRDFVRLRREI